MKKVGDIIRKDINNRKNNIEEEKSKKKSFLRKIRKTSSSKSSFFLSKGGQKEIVSNKSQRIFAKTRYWLLLITSFIVPLWFLPLTLDRIGLAKQLVLTILVGIAFILWLCESLTKGKINYFKNITNIGVFLFIVVIILSSVFSLHPETSLYASSSNFGNLWNFILLAVFYLLLISGTQKSFRSAKIINTFLISSVLAVLYALLQILGICILGSSTCMGSFNTIGTVYSVAILAGFCFLISLAKLIFRKNGLLWKSLLIGTVIVSFIYLILVNFQATFYGLILGIILIIFFKIKKQDKVEINSFVLPLAFLVVFLVWTFSGHITPKMRFWQPNMLNVRLSNLPTEVSPKFKTSIDIAKNLLHGSEKLVNKRNLLGVGLGNYDKMWSFYGPKEVNQTKFWQVNFSQGSSSFTTWLVETGYLGLLAIILLFLFSLSKGFRKAHKQRKYVVTIFIGLSYLVFLWFFYPYNLTLYFVIFLMLGEVSRKSTKSFKIDKNKALTISDKKKKEIRVISFSQPIQKALLVSLILIMTAIAVVFIAYFNIQRYSSYAYMEKANKLTNIESKDKNLEELIAEQNKKINQKINFLIKSYNLNRSNDKALRNLTNLYLRKIELALQLNKNADLNGLAQSTLLAAKRATEIDETNVTNWLNLAQAYESLIPLSEGAYDFALKNYDKASEMDPNNPSIFLGKGRSYFSEALRLQKAEKEKQKQTKLFELAVSDLEKAVELKPNYSPAHLVLSQVYDVQNRLKEAIISTSNLVLLNQNNSGLWFRLGLLYYRDENFEKAETALLQAIQLFENYSNARYFLGLTYARQNKTKKAITQFEKLIELNPDNEEIKIILDNLKANKAPLEGVTPPNQAPEDREELPITQTEQ